MKKRQENEVKTECASSATPDSWRTLIGHHAKRRYASCKSE